MLAFLQKPFTPQLCSHTSLRHAIHRVTCLYFFVNVFNSFRLSPNKEEYIKLKSHYQNAETHLGSKYLIVCTYNKDPA